MSSTNAWLSLVLDAQKNAKSYIRNLRTRNRNTERIGVQPTESKRSCQNSRFAKSASYTHALYKIWHRCYMDKVDFGQSRIKLSQNDILQMCRSKGKTPHSTMYVLPKHPVTLLTRENAIIVDKTQRRYLLALWRLKRDEDDYISHILTLGKGLSTNWVCDQ